VRTELAREEPGGGGRQLRGQALLRSFDRALDVILGGRHDALGASFGHEAYFGIR
jgi:hypothetical protein